jgi:DNA-binding response OmpR family regulator
MRVLIADDDRALVHMLGASFRKRGWDVIQAFDAMQAVMYSTRNPQPDVVVLDLGMPGGTGFLVLRRLARSARTSSIPVIVITGSEDEEAERAVGMGADAYLRKPVEPDAVIEMVEDTVGGPSP